MDVLIVGKTSWQTDCVRLKLFSQNRDTREPSFWNGLVCGGKITSKTDTYVLIQIILLDIWWFNISWLQHSKIRQITVYVVVIQPVPDHEFVGNIEGDKIGPPINFLAPSF